MPPTIREQSPNAHKLRIKGTQLIILVLLLVVIMLCLVLAWMTNDSMAQLPSLAGRTRNSAPAALVDLRPWQTAADLAGLAVTAEEQEYAHQAEHLADHEVDQAFAAALRLAETAAERRALTGDALALSQKVAALQKVVADDQARVRTLTEAGAQRPVVTTRSETPTLNAVPASDDLEIAKAQLGLDSDELADAQQDLTRATGDERARIQQELANHEAAMKKYDAEVAGHSQSAVVASRHYGTLASRIAAWFDQRNRYNLLLEAAQQSDGDTHSLTTKHSQMEAQSMNSGSTDDSKARLSVMRSRAMHSQVLSIFDDRIQTEQQLAAVYRRWAAQVQLQHRIVFHLLMQSFALVAFILISGILLDLYINHLLERPSLERRMYSYRLAARLAIQVVSVILIAFIIFGAPSQTPTILGLTTAGLTVVLQDFIISFCGWFVLMGKNGIRVGDWVEIDGVGGEVVDIGLFRTSLLETGNWTDRGHPTGRRVTFTNSFAIKGQFFNFTTSGQWMWDEITLSVPNADQAYGTVELIHKLVLEETEKESAIAEEEWSRLGRASGLSRFTTEAAVNMRPSASGIDIVVRYVTRASNRYHLRNVMYQKVIELLHKPALAQPAKTDELATSPASSV